MAVELAVPGALAARAFRRVTSASKLTHTTGLIALFWAGSTIEHWPEHPWAGLVACIPLGVAAARRIALTVSARSRKSGPPTPVVPLRYRRA